MPFADRLLSDDEELLAELRPHPVVLFAPVFLLAVALAAAIAIGVRFPQAPVPVVWVLAAMVALPAIWLVARVFRWRAVRLLVTSSRLVYRRGVVGRDVAQLRLQRVAEVHCTQSLWDRIIGCGRLVFEVVGDDPLVVDDVRRPRSVQRLIGSQLDELADPRFDRRVVAAATPAAPARAVAGQWAPLGPSPSWEQSSSMPAHPGPVGWDSTPPRGVATPPPSGRGASGSVAERLVQLDELRRRGVISQEEFAAKKAELLSLL